MPSHNLVELPHFPLDEKLDEFKKNEETLQELNMVLQKERIGLPIMNNKSSLNPLNNELIILKTSSMAIDTNDSDSGKLHLTPLNIQTPNVIINENTLEQANNAIHRKSKFKLEKWLKNLWRKFIGISFILINHSLPI